MAFYTTANDIDIVGFEGGRVVVGGNHLNLFKLYFFFTGKQLSNVFLSNKCSTIVHG